MMVSAETNIPKRRKIGRYLLLIGIVLAIPSWSLWLRVSATTQKVWITQSILYAVPYVVMLVCIATKFLAPVAYGIATPFSWYGMVSAFFFTGMGVMTLERTFFSMVVVIPAHLLMAIGLLLTLRRPTVREVGEWLIGVVLAIVFALSFLALLGRDTGHRPYPPIHGF